jgi:hypothetical protein
MTRLLKQVIQLLFLGCLFFPISCQKKNTDFEGVIKYRIRYEPLSDSFSVKHFIDYYGDTSIAYIKGGKYKQVYPNAKGISEVFYNSKNNLYYMHYINSDTILFVNTSLDKQHYKFNFITGVDTMILGYKCKCAIIIRGDDTTKYYYATDLPLSGNHFKNHKFGGYNLLTKNTNSVYLIQYTNFKKYSFSTEAFLIQKVHLQDSIFALPRLPIRNYFNGTQHGQ